jgi:hypothetical protein
MRNGRRRYWKVAGRRFSAGGTRRQASSSSRQGSEQSLGCRSGAIRLMARGSTSRISGNRNVPRFTAGAPALESATPPIRWISSGSRLDLGWHQCGPARPQIIVGLHRHWVAGQVGVDLPRGRDRKLARDAWIGLHRTPRRKTTHLTVVRIARPGKRLLRNWRRICAYRQPPRPDGIRGRFGRLDSLNNRAPGYIMWWPDSDIRN